MKRKYILAAAALAVLCVGAAAYSINQNTELPSSTPNSSSASSSVAPPSSEPASSSVDDQVAKEETTTGTGAGTTEQTLPTEDLSQPSDEEIIQSLMDRTGASREEVIASLEQVRKESEEAKKQEAEEKAAEEAKHNEWIAWREQECLEQTGMTYEEFSKMTSAEYFEWMNNHPDIDRSFLQGYPG